MSIPSTVKVVANLLLVPNNAVWFMAVIDMFWPIIVSLTAVPEYGLVLTWFWLPPDVVNELTNLLSPIVNL